jgi:hypothetical protein
MNSAQATLHREVDSSNNLFHGTTPMPSTLKYAPQWAIQTTENLAQKQWNVSAFNVFMSQATEPEFLQSQKPFYFAVKAFPQMLSLLASLIEDSHHRLVVMENLYEEHGHGNADKFHTTTYMQYLKALGLTQEHEQELINHESDNPWVTQWIENILSGSHADNALRLCAYLAGIECLYAVISQDICLWLKKHHLLEKQTHYTHHASLDWEHGTELFDLALQLKYHYGMKNPVLYKEHIMHAQIMESFNQAQKDFLELYHHLVVPTQHQLKKIHEQPISFYYIREDSKVETRALKNLIKDRPYSNSNSKSNPNPSQDKHQQYPVSILTIASGGEHIMEYLAQDYPVSITAIDLNTHQLDLAQKKIASLKSWGNPLYEQNRNTENKTDNATMFLPYGLDEHNTGKFEQIFALLRQSLMENGRVPQNIQQEKLHYVVKNLFTNDNLNRVFGEDATRFTKESFAQHFTEVFLHALDGHEANVQNIFYQKPVRNYAQLAHDIQLNQKKHKLTWEVVNCREVRSLEVESSIRHNRYDLIDVSNIGDWMGLNEYHQVIAFLNNQLNANGVIVARKLLGDYCLAHALQEHGLKVHPTQDSTGFYSETVYGWK